MNLAELDILVLEDDLMLGRRTAALLEKLGAEVSVAGTLQAARSLMSAIAFDIALLDVNLPDGLGTDLLREKRFGPDTTVVLVTAHGGVSGAVEAMRLGAAEYLVKPFEADELPPVLIQGETGTGKTALARWLHEHGPRGERELVEVNCSALPEALAESELFGHERGAFTDARTARMGLFEAASGGTLFLDELPSLSPPLRPLSPLGRLRLLANPWPGNVRELAHELERALIFEEGGALNFAQLPGDAREITQGAERPADAAWLRPGFQFPERGFALEEAINQFIQLALALDISQMREGTLAVRLFDREGRFVTAVPPTVEPMTLPARELEMLRCLQPARCFLEAARLNEQFLVVDESLPVRETMPLLEVNIPIHARGGGNPVACRRPAACGWAPAAARIRAH